MMWLLLSVLAAFAAVVAFRAWRFRPAPHQRAQAEPLEVDEAAVGERLRAMVRLPTVSDRDAQRMDAEAFERFRALLKAQYPGVGAACSWESAGRNGLMIRWPGRGQAAPSVLMAHYDVVPADAAEWDEPPFEGVVRDGELWGRGTLDTKCTVLGILEAAEALIRRGFAPAGDVYLAFGGDEECMGGDAAAIVDELERRGVRPAFVLDEGGAIVDHVFPGVSQSAALVGVAEKGSAFVDLTAAGKSGHASAPPARQSAAVLARALERIRRKPFPFTLSEPARALFDTLGRYAPFSLRLVFANLWCFAPALGLLCRLSGGELNALVRTTCAVTRLSGSEAYNVLPGQCRAGLNARIICGETVDGVRDRLQRVVGPDTAVSVVQGHDPSPVSPACGEAWERVSQAIREVYPDVIVAPYLMLACSDSRHYGRLCPNVYRFSGMPLSKAQREMIHGANERVPLALLPDLVRFFASVMSKC